MKHTHRIGPGHMGGKYTKGNMIEVEVVACDKTTASHAMWHFANWQLWGKEEDKVAWKGLAGFMGKEEIIEILMKEGRKKGLETTLQMVENGTLALLQPEVLKKAVEASQKTQRKLAKQGLHIFQNPELRARRAEEDRVKRKKEFEEGTAALLKPEVVAKRKRSSSRSRSLQNSAQVTCPHCGKTGGHTNMKRYHFDKCKDLSTSLPLTI